MSSIKILAATYGPADGQVTGTRDVAPFLRVLLLACQKFQHRRDDDNSNDNETDALFIPLMDGTSMNAIFGDPCPGTSKRLFVHYVVYESASLKSAETSEMHRVIFAEHERVVLRQRITFYQDEHSLQDTVEAAASKPEEEKQDASMPRAAVKIGHSQSIIDFAQVTTTTNEKPSAANMSHAFRSTNHWRLRSATSEIVLPIVMQFLDIRERVICQLVCNVWRIVVRHWGVAQTVDVNDTESFPHFNRAFLRGILTHSYSSLCSLYLNDFVPLTKDDLHPAIPHLRKLRALDISGCTELDDVTLGLISQHLNGSLEVFYMKGLRQVTDSGLLSICRTCHKLQVLEISFVDISDLSGIAIGENLTQLRALFMRDNYRLTNRSIDVITEKCTRLSQLTLWGIVRLKSLVFDTLTESSCVDMVVLNLWGCHSLADTAATALEPLKNLRSLIASECHRLTDAFVVGVAEKLPNIVHLHLRYCKRLTDAAVIAITKSMPNMYSLDLSFCTRITVQSISNLLEIRSSTLSELRLRNCHQLSINASQADGGGSAGRSFLVTLQAVNHCLCILDVRNCGPRPPASHDNVFSRGMASLQFDQKVPGFFSRAARWNTNVKKRLFDELMSSYLKQTPS